MRIASLISSATEILFSLALDENIVAVSHECDYPPRAADKPRVTRCHVDAAASSREIDRQVRALAEKSTALYELDIDRLSALRPDLIVTQAQCDVCAVRYADVLEAVASRPALAQARIIALNPQSLGDVLADVETLGIATGAALPAANLKTQLAARIETVRSATADVPADRRPRVALVEWLDPLMLSGNWVPEMVQLAGGRHDLTHSGRHSSYVSWHDLAAYDPQVMLVLPCGFDLDRTLREWRILKQQPGWAGLSAVQNGRVLAIDGNAYFNRSGPRLVDSLEILGHLVHPDRLAAPAHLIAERCWRLLD